MCRSNLLSYQKIVEKISVASYMDLREKKEETAQVEAKQLQRMEGKEELKLSWRKRRADVRFYKSWMVKDTKTR